MKFERFIVIFGLFTLSNAVTLLDIHGWIAFKLKHAKRYKNFFEDIRRRDIYIENARKVREHNQRFDRGESSFRLALNKYSDLTHEEFISTLYGLKTSPRARRNATLFFQRARKHIPNSFDWREKGAVTDVKDQGHCGSCWSFSTTGAIEGQHFLKKKKLVSLSEQNLVDCSQDFGNKGCKGGLMDKAFDYIISNGGIDTEESYPYKGVDDTCSYNDKNVGATIRRYEDLPEGDEDALKRAIATIGPIAVAIDASNPSFQQYSSGIYQDENCSSEHLDHAVLAVGYDTDEKGNEYYIVKNSWGTTWGDQGYIKMARNKKNQCGIASMSSYPII